ncbi:MULTISPECIES: glyceraldehyde-3-phosphate dehydrogenase [Rhodobacterales]|uniref:Glyceraldehyde-3-phosphate dehydrogenase n=1 Tax=Rhodobacter calidifons TaxID=2715277 RepID=A0ABX0G6A0_9RHOB|nr:MULTISPECIES: glyceraldehyde-3-phosphate dehydrogenase [Paracoccaceae]NHB76808.1 glyceraldehyde-3-phosphate dehydrogenase [Rhodobacter calidifons]
MTNTIALWLGLVILAGIIADIALNGGSALMFLARKFLDLVEWVDFWN